MNRLLSSVLLCVLGAAGLLPAFSAEKTERRLYVAVPGIRNYVEWGGVGVLVYDIDHGHRFVKRIPTWTTPAGKEVEAVKGICACAKTGKLYVSTTARLGCIDLASEKMLWEKTYAGGCDRMSITPDGKTIYLPSLEGPFWNVVDGSNGEIITKVEPNSGSHNTIVSPDGSRAYLAGLKSPWLWVTDARTHEVVQKVGPFSNVIRPFTVNGANTRCYVNVNELLGFEVGDVTTGKPLASVKVPGYDKGPTKRHGCPSHGIALTPDEKELWLTDARNERLHLFDNTVFPPKYRESIKLGDQPGWVTFSIDGKLAYPSSGEVIDIKSRRILTTLKDENGKPVQSEKLLEIDFAGGKPVRNGDQFARGQKR